MYIYSIKSQDRLDTCCADLTRLFNEVIHYKDCKILCGRRTRTKQDVLYPKFTKVKYPNSRHNSFPSEAVDVVPWFKEKPHIRWNDINSFYEFAGFVLGIASQMDIQVEWGGHFKGFFDGPHFQTKRR